VGEFAERHADYEALWTNDVTKSDAHAFAQRAGLRDAFHHPAGFYVQKLKSMMGRSQTLRHLQRHRGLWDI
jgi:hypothetical protein